jgi:hypothetical protein
MEERSSWSRQKDEAILEETGKRRWFGGWRLKEIFLELESWWNRFLSL